MKTNFFSLGLIGWRLGHSYSPVLHAAALTDCGLAGEYRLHAVSPGEAGRQALAELCTRLAGGELHGLNVTIPHKQAVLEFVHGLSPAARQVAAVNTLVARDGEVWGENTDIPGFLADLQRLGVEIGERQALILGAGGAARAAAYALHSSGCVVTVAARRVAQAQMLLEQLSIPGAAVALDEAGLRAAGSGCDLLVNATPLGMAPDVAVNPWSEAVSLPQGAFVYDMVYNPAETRLLQAARAAGLAASNGLGMLVEQAALAFELWTGCAPRRAALWQALAAI